MSTRWVRATADADGEVTVRGLPVKKGETIDLIIVSGEPARAPRPWPTARGLLRSGLVGAWGDRDDIGDSAEFARRLRAEAERRTAE